LLLGAALGGVVSLVLALLWLPARLVGRLARP
jgi:enterochelin esterase-like enzyme